MFEEWEAWCVLTLATNLCSVTCLAFLLGLLLRWASWQKQETRCNQPGWAWKKQEGLGTPRMVFATLGTAGKSRKGWWAPCWAPRVVATFQHWGESGRPASKPSYPASREQAGRAPTYFPTLSSLSCPVLPRCALLH